MYVMVSSLNLVTPRFCRCSAWGGTGAWYPDALCRHKVPHPFGQFGLQAGLGTRQGAQRAPLLAFDAERKWEFGGFTSCELLRLVGLHLMFSGSIEVDDGGAA